MRIYVILLALFFLPGNGVAQTDLFALFPDKEISGWSRLEEPKRYNGEELFLMIDGGADIYFEYGFSQVLAGDFENEKGELIRLEIYEMESAESAYGIYSFKIGQDGKPLKIGQAAQLEEYYLNFWKGNLLVTVAGSDSQSETIEAVSAFGKFVDQRYAGLGKVPKLVELLASEPVSLVNPKYVRGSIGGMADYVFDTEDIFEVREGVIGFIEDNQVLVFQYADKAASEQIFNSATAGFASNNRFSDTAVLDNVCSMVGRNNESVVVMTADRNIVIVIGQNPEITSSLAGQLLQKLKSF